ncbi:hypothetical protein Dimus_000313 [Dionaea muscipula]
MGSWASETLHLPPELKEKISEFYPGVSYEEAIEDQAIISQSLETSWSCRPATRGEASSSHDLSSLIMGETDSVYDDLDYNEAVARSLQDQLDHLSVSESVESASGTRGNASASLLDMPVCLKALVFHCILYFLHDLSFLGKTQGVNQADIDVDQMTYEELNSLGEAMGSKSKGLSANDIEKLQFFEYKGSKPRFFCRKGKATGEDKTKECSICFMAFKKGEKVIALPCLHQYHKGCITHWLTVSKICPICRVEVEP